MFVKNKFIDNIFYIGLSFEESTKHVVAWQTVQGLKQVNVTLVDNLYENNKAHIGSYGKLIKK